jgi:hypothetical protein
MHNQSEALAQSLTIITRMEFILGFHAACITGCSGFITGIARAEEETRTLLGYSGIFRALSQCFQVHVLFAHDLTNSLIYHGILYQTCITQIWPHSSSDSYTEKIAQTGQMGPWGLFHCGAQHPPSPVPRNEVTKHALCTYGYPHLARLDNCLFVASGLYIITTPFYILFFPGLMPHPQEIFCT